MVLCRRGQLQEDGWRSVLVNTCVVGPEVTLLRLTGRCNAMLTDTCVRIRAALDGPVCLIYPLLRLLSE